MNLQPIADWIYAILPPGKDWIDAFEALGTPIIAALAAAFAWRAYRLEKKRREDELFDRCFEYFKNLKSFWLSTGEGASPGEKSDVPFDIMAEWIDTAEILFGRDISRLLASLPESGHAGGGGRFLEPHLHSAFVKAIRLKA